ncbi:MAG: helix-turn-helix domain-containing protein [Gammaproteobacteria bacterium]|nr:helix-turn-helix domain-containing protein [Gammaproteobacteria bacterium]
MNDQTGDQTPAEQDEKASSNALGNYIRKARQDARMTLREVEEATNKEVSNGYLSQLESGKISKPSPHVLYTLSTVLRADYQTLMLRAGYILPGTAQRKAGVKHGRASTYAIDNLTAEEESELLEYLTFLRSKKK